MSTWSAVSYGTLDISAGGYGMPEGSELLVTPIIPAPPRLLHGAGADLWRRLVAQPLDFDDLSQEDQAILIEMQDLGIASSEPSHPYRVRGIPAPWLGSPIHELVYALLGSIAAEEGIDLIFIKGPTLHAQGLRDREHSGDVDCLVRPDQGITLARAMQPWGWSPALSAFTETPVLHSLTLRAGGWGCAVDVHTWFPGFTIDAEEAFEELARVSEERGFAGHVGRTPSRPAHAVLSSLHELRPFNGRQPSDAQVDLASRALRVAGEESLDFARATGAEFVLAEAALRAFPNVEFVGSDAKAPADWAWRSATSPVGAYVEALRLLPLRARLRTVWRIIWPGAEQLRNGPIGVQNPADSVPVLRLKRLAQALHTIRE